MEAKYSYNKLVFSGTVVYKSTKTWNLTEYSVRELLSSCITTVVPEIFMAEDSTSRTQAIKS
jgi:hypothetical protein